MSFIKAFFDFLQQAHFAAACQNCRSRGVYWHTCRLYTRCHFEVCYWITRVQKGVLQHFLANSKQELRHLQTITLVRMPMVKEIRIVQNRHTGRLLCCVNLSVVAILFYSFKSRGTSTSNPSFLVMLMTVSMAANMRTRTQANFFL